MTTTELNAKFAAMSGADKVGLKLNVAFLYLQEQGVERDEAFRRAWAYAMPDINFDDALAEIAAELNKGK